MIKLLTTTLIASLIGLISFVENKHVKMINKDVVVSTFITPIADTPKIVFNEKISSAETPLAISFTYNKKLIKFYVYADYLMPNKKNKEKNRHELSIKASVYEGIADDLNDGALLSVTKTLELNKPLPMTGNFLVNNYHGLDIKSGYITITKCANNKISGTFTAKGTAYAGMYDTKADGSMQDSNKATGKFTITDGKFTDIPVTVQRISSFKEGFQRPV